MTVKEEAKELVFGFYKIVGLDGFGYDCNPIDIIDNGLHKIAQKRSRECTLICVDKLIEYINNSIKSDGIINHVKGLGEIVRYRELKQEIEKL